MLLKRANRDPTLIQRNNPMQAFGHDQRLTEPAPGSKDLRTVQRSCGIKL
jgi:hypothetical protein